jgi:hypothetical protein
MPRRALKAMVAVTLALGTTDIAETAAPWLLEDEWPFSTPEGHSRGSAPVVAALFDAAAGQHRVNALRVQLGFPPATIPSQPSPSLDRARPSGEFTKGATDRRSLDTLALYQQLQAIVLHERLRAGASRPVRVLLNATPSPELNHARQWARGVEATASWSVPCDDRMYSKESAYGIIAGCSPTGRAPCQRRVHDEFATPEECAALIGAADVAMRGLFHQGDQTAIAPASSAKLLISHNRWHPRSLAKDCVWPTARLSTA